MKNRPASLTIDSRTATFTIPVSNTSDAIEIVRGIMGADLVALSFTGPDGQVVLMQNLNQTVNVPRGRKPTDGVAGDYELRFRGTHKEPPA